MTCTDRHKGAGGDRLNPRLVRVLERKVDRVKLNLLGTPFPVRKEYAEDAPQFSTQMPVVVQGFGLTIPQSILLQADQVIQ